MKRNIRGEWIAADPSTNHVDLAQTDEQNVVAVRSSYDPDQQLYLTEGQFKGLIGAARQGRFDTLVPGASQT